MTLGDEDCQALPVNAERLALGGLLLAMRVLGAWKHATAKRMGSVFGNVIDKMNCHDHDGWHPTGHPYVFPPHVTPSLCTCSEGMLVVLKTGVTLTSSPP